MPDTNSNTPAEPSTEALPFWLRLANLSFSPRLTASLLEHFHNDPCALFAARDAELDEVPLFESRHLVRLRDRANEATERQLRWCERYGVRIIEAAHPEYPRLLLTIADPPPFLFVRGSLAGTQGNCVGMVGSRRATPYGKSVAERFARELAGQGLTIVSGGAVGIDTAAHRGAVNAGGRTVAVLGCGLDVDYPRDNRELFEKVAATGALVSEYAPGAQPEAWRFPARNRIISGMSQGILVVEAPLKSGALITAHCAAEQGRTLMTVPGNIDRPSSDGSNDLLRVGATPVLGVEDILQALNLVRIPARPEHQRAFDLLEEGRPTAAPRGTASPYEAESSAQRKAPAPQKISFPALPPGQEKLIQCLSQTPQHIDSLAQQTGMTAGEAGVELTFLELDGLIRRLPGNTYIRTF